MKSILLFVMLATFGVLVYVRHDSNAATTMPKVAFVKAERAPAQAAPLARTLRTVAVGAELLAPGVVAADRFKAAKLETSFATVPSTAEVEAALAKGGGEANGADIAIVPLSSYVASYERLNALQLDVVFVVGWSHREALYGADASALAKARGKMKLAGAQTAPETFFALFLLDLAGVPASNVELVGSTSLTATTRGKKASGKLVLTSADTPALMPIVAVAPRSFAKSHRGELEAWAKVWLGGAAQLATDVPAGGRAVATHTNAPAIGVIEALGQLRFATLRENAVAMGLSGRGALTLDESFKTAWRIWRATGVITTPAPEAVPLDTSVVAALVRANPKAIVEQERPRAAESKRPSVLMVVRVDGKLEPEAFVAKIGHVAGVFDRSPLRVSVRGDQKTAQLYADMARDRFNLRPAQLSTGAKPPAGTATIEILSAP